MTKREREITDMEEILRILDKCKVVHVGLTDQEQPYIVPMNYGYTYENGELTFYLHGALQGYKYDLIKKNPKVCFEMECDIMPFEGRTACQYGMVYSSIMGKGTAEIVESPQEKIRDMEILMKTQTGKDFTFNEKLVSIINVIKIHVTEFTAKKRPLPEGQQNLLK